MDLDRRSWSNPVPKPKSSNTEVEASAQHDRRQRGRFSAEYKERILREADACSERAWRRDAPATV
jgi:hypothetical protein